VRSAFDGGHPKADAIGIDTLDMRGFGPQRSSLTGVGAGGSFWAAIGDASAATAKSSWTLTI